MNDITSYLGCYIAEWYLSKIVIITWNLLTFLHYFHSFKIWAAPVWKFSLNFCVTFDLWTFNPGPVSEWKKRLKLNSKIDPECFIDVEISFEMLHQTAVVMLIPFDFLLRIFSVIDFDHFVFSFFRILKKNSQFFVSCWTKKENSCLWKTGSWENNFFLIFFALYFRCGM